MNVTPSDVIAGAELVFASRKPARWPDCPRRLDDLHLHLFDVSCMGEAGAAYCDPRSALRFLGTASYEEKFAEVVRAAGLVECEERPGAIGCFRQPAAFLGWSVAMCAEPGIWVHPLPFGYEIRGSASPCWGLGRV